MTQGSVANPDFFNCCAEDGWFAELKIDKDYNADLIFGLMLGQAIVNAKLVTRIVKASPLDIGKLKRKLILLEGIAEFLNAGGTPQEIPLAVFDTAVGIRLDGWNYFDTWLNPKGNRVHEFVNDEGNRFVRWVRHEYIDANLTAKDMDDAADADTE